MPVELPKILQDIGSFDDSGKMQELKLLGPQNKIFFGKNYDFEKSDVYAFSFLKTLLVVLAISLLCYFVGPDFLKLRLIGLSLTFFALLSSLFSTVMIFLWVFTDYSFTHHNALLFGFLASRFYLRSTRLASFLF